VSTAEKFVLATARQHPSLQVAVREISVELAEARVQLERFAESTSDTEPLESFAGHLHAVRGALRVAEVYGGALLAEEMEQVAGYLREHCGEGRFDEDALEALVRAMEQLPTYVERVASGGRDVPIALLPLLNDLRAARGGALLSEGTLLMLNLRSDEPARSPAESEPGDAAELARRLRPRFQLALLGWIRGEQVGANLEALAEISAQIESHASTQPLFQLWWVTGAVLEALEQGGLENNVSIKRLLGQVDRELRRVQEHGEPGYSARPPLELLNNLLFYVARSSTCGPRVEAVRRSFRLADILPADARAGEDDDTLSAPSVRLMKTVAAAIREDLTRVKDVLDIFVRQGGTQVQQLAPQLEMLHKISDTLGVLGLGQLRDRVQSEIETLQAIVEHRAAPEDDALLGIAAALIEVEDGLDGQLLRLIVREAAPATTDENEPTSEEFLLVQAAVLRECAVNMARIKEAVAQSLNAPEEAQGLDQVPQLVRGITAGLLMLGRQRAVEVMQQAGRVLATIVRPDVDSLEASRLDKLAEAIVAVEYYMELLQAGQPESQELLDAAEASLGSLAAAERRVVPLHGPGGAGQEAAAEPVPTAAETPAEPPAVTVSTAGDPEFVALFVEEARENAAYLEELFPRWEQDPQDTDSLRDLRRIFHTLKGSGRMVGAARVGEFSWCIESLLNRVISETLARSPEIVAITREAVQAMPQLIDELELGGETGLDLASLMSRADALSGREGSQPPLPPAVAIAQPPPAAVAEAEAVEPPVADTGMDPVLREIFRKETEAHIAVVRDYLASCESGPAPFLVSEALYRACHTLSGIAKTAKVRQAIKVAEPMERYVRKLFENGHGLTAEGLALLGDTLRGLETVSENMAEDATGFFPNHDALTAGWHALERALDAELARLEEAASVPQAVEPDFDADIAAIFSEEASELLEQAETALTSWRQDPADGRQLTELKRLLHTVKGGARMAGIRAMGDLSHEIESFLASVESGEVESGPECLEVLQSSLDELHRMREKASSGQWLQPAETLIARVRALAVPARERGIEAPAAAVADEAAGLRAPAPVPAESAGEEAAAVAGPVEPAEPVEAEPPIEASQTEVEEIEAIEEIVLSAPPELPQAAEPGEEPPLEQVVAEEPAAPVPQPPQQVAAPGLPKEPEFHPVLPGREPVAPVERHELARVDAELLDDLLNNAGEASIFRARVEQQLTSIEFNLTELGRTVTRLREQLRKLEMETEAQILFRHQEDGEGRRDFDPLELDRYSTIQQLSRALAESASDVASIEGLLGNLNREGQNLLQQQGRVITELQNGLMRTRMVPFQRHVQRLGRLVRQAAQESGKRVELDVEGATGELDRQVLERMLPPLEHMLRNAVVHGVEPPAERVARGKPETGRIRVELKREGAEVVVTVEDDGAGLNVGAIRDKARRMGLLPPDRDLTDEEALQLVLEPGFSTADRLTQQAGRGVGMDVVSTEVKKLGGALFIESFPGHGARFVVRLPFTLAITQALIVRVHDELYALPVATVEGVARLPSSEIAEHLAEEQPTFEYGGQAYRFQQLGSFIGSPPSLLPEGEAAVPVILVRAGEHSSALVTDELVGSREIVVKPLGPQISSIRGIAGATILGDGRIVVILDIGALVRSEWRTRPPQTAERPTRDERVFALVVDDSITVRRVTQRLLERNGMRVITARDGMEAMSLLQEHTPDVILLDIEMPRMDGYEVASQVRNDARLADVPIIMITSRVSDKHRARAIELGVDDYLGKPYQESQLLDAIEPLVLARRRQRG
jgi:chemosensory pili system protein ChpA (sensor histidine kinase/response regulator)